MPKYRKTSILLICLLVAAGILFWWIASQKGWLSSTLKEAPTKERALPQEQPIQAEQGEELPSPPSATPTPTVKRAAIPKASAGTSETRTTPEPLPPSPPLPQISEDTTQQERKEAYQLEKSVDFIVRKDEPFELEGKKWTIADIQKKLGWKELSEEIAPPIEESDLASAGQKSTAGPKLKISKIPRYYAVKIVRPGENLWNIHFAIIREYLARRGIHLPPTSDEPRPDGKSSGIGRLLKFIEGIVFVYDTRKNQLEENLDLIYPNTVIIFFNISELFSALDQLQPEDLESLRYVKNQIRIERPNHSSELLDRRNFLK